MDGRVVLSIDPGREVLACVAMRDGRVEYAECCALRGKPQTWEEVLVRWMDTVRPDEVVVEAQNMGHGTCAFVEGLARGIAAGRGITAVRHVPATMHAQVPGFGTYRVNKKRAVEIVSALAADSLHVLRAAQAGSPRPDRTDAFDAAMFVLWHTRPGDVKLVPVTSKSCGAPKKTRATAPARKRTPTTTPRRPVRKSARAL